MNTPYIIENIHFVNPWAAIWAPLLMIILDFATGFVGAFIRGEKSSHVMLVGGGHKFAELVCIGVALIFDHSVLLPVKLVYIVSAYIMVMEALSIWENVKKLFGKKKVPATVDHTLGHIKDELFDDSVLEIEHSASEDEK